MSAYPLEVINIPQATVDPVPGVNPPPQPPMLPIEQDFQGAQQTTEFAVQHANEADSYIQSLGDLARALVPPSISPQFPTNTNGPAVSVPAPPAVLPVIWTAPAVPSAFTGSLNVDESFPTFSVQPPSLLFPNAPNPNFGTTPAQPGIDLNFKYPTVQVDLPPAPDLLSLQTYAFGGVDLPTLSATAPVLAAVAPAISAYLEGAPYTDALLSELQQTLQDRLDIGNTGTNTGLPPKVEENIWNRAREREVKQAGEAIAALDRMESMGFSLPPGAFTDAQIKIQTELAATTIGLSRDIAIKQAELEQENIKTALTMATQIESKLIDYANQRAQREFEAAKYATEAGISIYNADVEAYKARVEVYKAAIDIYNAQMQGARLTVEIYQAELEAEKIKVDMNTALVQQYEAQIRAALASIQVFQGEIDIIKTQAEIEQLKVSVYGQQVQAYVAQINAYTAEVEGYKAAIEAEQSKEQVYATQATVFKTQVDAVTAEINSKVEIFKAQIAAKEMEYDAYKALVAGQAAQVQAIASSNDSTARVYTAEVSGTSAYNDAIIKEWQAALDESIQVTQIGVKAAEANAQMYLTTRSIASDAAKVGAQVEAQLAASALGTVTYATHRARQDNVSNGVTASYGNSASNSSSRVASNSTSKSSSANTSTSDTDQVSSSVSTNTNHNISSVE